MNIPIPLEALAHMESIELYPNESAAFLLQKVDWEKVIELGQSTEFGTLTPMAPLPEPALKQVQISGTALTMTFEHRMPWASELPEITVNGRRAELLVLDCDALTLGFDMAARPDTTTTGRLNVNLNDDMDTVWLSTMGYALSDGVMLCGPTEPPSGVVKDFQLGEDQLVLTELLLDVWEPGQSLDPWLQFTQQGADGVLRIDDSGQGDFQDALQMTLEDFYRHNPHITNLGADELRQVGGFDL